MGAPEPEQEGGDLRTTCYNCGVSLLKDEGHIRCKGKDYCGTCFAASDTNRQEPYLVIPSLNFVPSRDSQCSQDTPIPAENDPPSASGPPDASIWTVADTLALLDAVAKVGVGSWDDVLARMHQAGAGSSKEITSSQCRSWFMLLYSTWEASSSSGKATKDSIAGQVLGADGHCSVMNPMADHEGPVVDSVLGKRKRDASSGSDLDKYIPGYTPRRGDFEVDYDDCAELLLADMEFQPNERPEDVKIKVDVLLAYNARLSLREQMKRYVVAREMVLQQPPPPAYPRSGGGVPPPPPVNAQTRAGQILNRLFRPVERFFDSKGECDEFKQLLLEEQRITHRLEELEGPSRDSTAAAAADAAAARSQQGSIPDAWMRKHVLRKRRVNKDIVKSECVKNLGEQELQWCREVDVSPHHFALVRDALVREAVKGSPEGGGSSSGPRPLVLKVSRAEPLSRTFKFEVVSGEDKTFAAPPKPEASV